MHDQASDEGDAGEERRELSGEWGMIVECSEEMSEESIREHVFFCFDVGFVRLCPIQSSSNVITSSLLSVGHKL
jgi:hypothetical protein